MLKLDAETDVASATAALTALLAAPSERCMTLSKPTKRCFDCQRTYIYAFTKLAQNQRPDLQTFQFNVQVDQKLARAQEMQYLPSISAFATGGLTPVRPDGVFAQNWYAPAGVNLSVPLFMGFRIDAQAKEARL